MRNFDVFVVSLSELIVVRDLGRQMKMVFKLRLRAQLMCVCMSANVSGTLAPRDPCSPDVLAACTYSLLRVSAMLVETLRPAEVMVSYS